MRFIGNKKIVSLLQNSLERGALNHAYIFSGPEYVGKFTLAKLFASAAIAGGDLNSDNCEINRDALLDMISIEPEIVEKKGISKQRDISIESVRQAKQKLSLFPYCGKYKVLIINDAHRMNVSAQNALLKILEEPNETSMIILITHEVNRILPTINSRCQMINFGLIGDGDLQAVFSKEITELAVGRPGLAVIMNEQQEQKDFRKETKFQFEKIINGSLNERFVLAEEMSKDISKTLEKLAILTWEMRRIALEASEEERGSLFGKIEKIQQSTDILKRTNANSRLILETLFMDL